MVHAPGNGDRELGARSVVDVGEGATNEGLESRPDGVRRQMGPPKSVVRGYPVIGECEASDTDDEVPERLLARRGMSLEIARSELLIRIAPENDREIHPGGREVKAGI